MGVSSRVMIGDTPMAGGSFGGVSETKEHDQKYFSIIRLYIYVIYIYFNGNRNYDSLTLNTVGKQNMIVGR